jgi:hypothetical protein
MKTTVYHFRVYDGTTDKHIGPPLKGTAERIERNQIPCEILTETAEEVDVLSLDEYGRYDPSKNVEHA